MRILFILLCLANIAFAFGTLPWLPNPTPNHFGLDGTANGFGPPLLSAVLTSVIVVFMTAMFLGFSWLLAICPPYCFNVPNRDYWLNDENRPETVRRIRFFLESFGIATMLFFLIMQWATFRAATAVPPKMEPYGIWIATAVLFVYILVETVRLTLSFRQPKEKQ